MSPLLRHSHLLSVGRGTSGGEGPTSTMKKKERKVVNVEQQYMYSACMVIVFFTLVMYYGKRVHFHEVPFGYDEIQQNCH